MASDHSVTDWIDKLKVGDDAAAQHMFERYFGPMVRLARARLKNKPRRDRDEDDVALSAFASFCRGAKQGKFPQLKNRDKLWGLLVVITRRKAVDELQRARRKKRGGGAVRGESAFADNKSSADERGIEQVASNEPTPQIAVLMAGEFERLLDLLPDETYRDIALMKMDGYSNDQIAATIERHVRTVERKLDDIRSFWKEYRDERGNGKE
jgi:DNA-directed RNA polymerase specialized sigma24 family protein